MRNINTKDLFHLMRIATKSGIKEKILKMKAPKNISDHELGILLVFEVLEAVPELEGDILKFLADIGECTVDELKNDEFVILPKIIDHLKKQEGFIDFLSKLFAMTK